VNQYRPLFITSTARSGSYLISMMLSANPGITVASEPYLELFRSLRNDIIQHDAPLELQKEFGAELPLQDYYFTDARIQCLDIIQSATLDLPFDTKGWDSFLEACSSRCALQCKELVPYLHKLKGDRYRDVFNHGLEIIASARNAEKCKWIGIKDAWTIEFFTPLARAYPEARFIVILRDPRAVINSMLGVKNIDSSQVAHTLSYIRHWRKYVAFVAHFLQNSLLKDRLYVLTHEQVLQNPEKQAREMCDFLGVDYDNDMLDTDKYIDFATGKTWNGNSSFEKTTSGISMHRAKRWRKTLPENLAHIIDFLCGPDMKIVGFEPLGPLDQQWPHTHILEHIIKTDLAFSNWRSDLRDPQQDFGFELFRNVLLAMPEGFLSKIDQRLIRRSFLFEEAFVKLRQQALIL
jgi:hypothetical protein